MRVGNRYSGFWCITSQIRLTVSIYELYVEEYRRLAVPMTAEIRENEYREFH